MGTATKVLAILNVLAGIGFLVFAGIDYGKRQGWEYAVLQQQFQIRGLPVDENEEDVAGNKLVGFVRPGNRLQQDLFSGAGQPLQTEKEAAQQRHDELLAAVQGAGNPAAQKQKLEEILVPLARIEGERRTLHQQIAAQNVDVLLGPDGPFEKACVEAVQGKTASGQALSYDQWRQAVAHLLFNTGDDYKRTLAIVGAAAFAQEVDGQATALAAMAPTLDRALASDLANFEVQHASLNQAILALANRLRDLEDTKAKQETLLAQHKAHVAEREGQAVGLQKDIQAAKQATQNALAMQHQIETHLFNTQQTIADAEHKNEQLERQIRVRESGR
jgi:hypothetical protein